MINCKALSIWGYLVHVTSLTMPWKPLIAKYPTICHILIVAYNGKDSPWLPKNYFKNFCKCFKKGVDINLGVCVKLAIYGVRQTTEAKHFVKQK